MRNTVSVVGHSKDPPPYRRRGGRPQQQQRGRPSRSGAQADLRKRHDRARAPSPTGSRIRGGELLTASINSPMPVPVMPRWCGSAARFRCATPSHGLLTPTRSALLTTMMSANPSRPGLGCLNRVRTHWQRSGEPADAALRPGGPDGDGTLGAAANPALTQQMRPALAYRSRYRAHPAP